MPQVRHAHCSSKYSGSVASLSKQVTRGAEHEDPSCNLMTWTEIDTKQRAAELQADGWGKYAPHQDTDCAVMWRKERWTLVDSFFLDRPDMLRIDSSAPTTFGVGRKAVCRQ